MRIPVAGQQHQLKEEQAGDPNRRSTTEQRQHHLSDHRFEPEQQECAQKQGRCEQGKEAALFGRADRGFWLRVYISNFTRLFTASHAPSLVIRNYWEYAI